MLAFYNINSLSSTTFQNMDTPAASTPKTSATPKRKPGPKPKAIRKETASDSASKAHAPNEPTPKRNKAAASSKLGDSTPASIKTSSAKPTSVKSEPKSATKLEIFSYLMVFY